VSDNPLDSDPERDARIHARAYALWEEEGRPHGRDMEFWERARELEAIEHNPPGLLPNPLVVPPKPVIEEAEIQQNLGEFPGGLTDQGESPQTPLPRKKKTSAKKPAAKGR
jgi:hypothetical protein